jgi:RNA polymerase sigma factor (TIGR02999 family)
VAWRQGEAAALDELMPLVHEELRRVAKRHMRHERGDHTLQASALVNEAYLRLIEIKRVQWRDRVHFLAMASRVMRRILVDSARAKANQKRGGRAQRISFDEAMAISITAPDLVALGDALDTLQTIDPRKCQVVEMRFFAGLSVDEAADALQVSVGTVMRDWRLAKAWLARELSGGRRDT